MQVSKAIILAAGLGERMRPLTNDRPKPLIDVDGKPLLDYALDGLSAAGVTNVVVNHHYLGDQIVDHVGTRQGPPKIILSDEQSQLLDTGGGPAMALPHLGESPFFVVNSDAIWIDQGTPILIRMAQAWDDAAMDFLLMVVPLERTTGFDGSGDFDINDSGQLALKGDKPSAPYAYCGVQLVHPRVFVDIPSGPFSVFLLWHRAMAEGRFFGIEHAGKWLHVGTPQGRDDAEAFLRHR